MKQILKISCLLLIIAGCANSIHKTPDLDFIYQTILENHPGVYNNQDPNFNKHLKQSYMHAKNGLLHVNTVEENKIILDEFAQSFNDGHLLISQSRGGS